MRHKMRIATLVAMAAGIALFFQNCGGVNFSTLDNASLKQGGGDQELEESQKAGTQVLIDKVDVLFVLDESVSMGTIINNVRDGFQALTSAHYPADTRMAVTNMEPAYYTDPAAGQFDLARSFLSSNVFENQPGFIKLVSRASLDAFRSSNPTESAKMTLQGCGEWFTPAEKDGQNESCLLGATQAALLATGVEAGTVTLRQLAEATASKGQRLFREGALVNVIFISDTHDAGYPSYYGHPGGLSKMQTPAELRDRIYTLNPGLEGLRSDGIVTLPPAGDARLTGVHVIGDLPATLNDSVINGEGVNDFSYMPFIQESGGAAMHAANNDWVEAIASMVTDLRHRVNPVITLSHTVARIISVSVDGVELSDSQYIVRDGNRVEVTQQPSWPETVEIRVRYVPY
jgi:hypothetical protein